MNNTEHGYLTGETCGRNNCNGIIDEHKKEGCCSCHNNPPCSYCVDDNHFCPECGWEGLDEQKSNNSVVKKFDLYKVRTINDLDRSKIDYINIGHTHFTMKKIGVYPEGTTREQVAEKVRGTFGGRFEEFYDGKFVYIAYTD